MSQGFLQLVHDLSGCISAALLHNYLILLSCPAHGEQFFALNPMLVMVKTLVVLNSRMITSLYAVKLRNLSLLEDLCIKWNLAS